MRAFPSYYRGRPQIDRIVWKSYTTARTSWAAMMRGEIDFLFEVSPDAFEFMSGEGSVGKFSFLRNYVHGIVFNSHRPFFRDSRVRRALNYAIDRSAIIDQAFKGHGVPANTPTWPQHWANVSDSPSYTYDPARAAALLDAAGLTVGQTNSDRGPARLRFTCIFPTSALWERMALLVQRNFSQVGVDMQLEQLSLRCFQSANWKWELRCRSDGPRCGQRNESSIFLLVLNQQTKSVGLQQRPRRPGTRSPSIFA